VFCQMGEIIAVGEKTAEQCRKYPCSLVFLHVYIYGEAF
jgi:uroporphyrinogen-III synthase